MVAGGDDGGLRARDRSHPRIEGDASPRPGRLFPVRRIMTSTPTATLRRRRLVNEAMLAYVDWREACLAVTDAYAASEAAGKTDARLAFGAYTAALDREERAAQVYADVIGRAGAGR